MVVFPTPPLGEKIVMTLPPEAFTPPPKIHSAVVHLTALPAPRYPADPAILSRVVAAGFNQRRKMLRASLKGVAPDIEDKLRAAGMGVRHANGAKGDMIAEVQIVLPTLADAAAREALLAAAKAAEGGAAASPRAALRW